MFTGIGVGLGRRLLCILLWSCCRGDLLAGILYDGCGGYPKGLMSI